MCIFPFSHSMLSNFCFLLLKPIIRAHSVKWRWIMRYHSNFFFRHFVMCGWWPPSNVWQMTQQSWWKFERRNPFIQLSWLNYVKFSVINLKFNKIIIKAINLTTNPNHHWYFISQSGHCSRAFFGSIIYAQHKRM